MRHRKSSARESSPSCWSTTLCAVARSNRVELDVSTNRSQGLGAFDQKALKAIGPEHPVGTMTAVVPLGKTIFGLEGLRTADGSDWTSGRQNRGQVKSQGQWGVSARPLRLEALFRNRRVAAAARLGLATHHPTRTSSAAASITCVGK
jgi:hypothetical protein